MRRGRGVVRTKRAVAELHGWAADALAGAAAAGVDENLASAATAGALAHVQLASAAEA